MIVAKSAVAREPIMEMRYFALHLEFDESIAILLKTALKVLTIKKYFF